MVANTKQLLFGFKNKKNLALESRDFGIWISILLNFSNKVDLACGNCDKITWAFLQKWKTSRKGQIGKQII